MTLLTTIKTDKPHAPVQRFAGPRTGSTIDILGVAVSDLPRADALSFLHARFDDPAFTKVAFLNAHGANIATRDDAFRAVLSGFLVLPDGIGVDIAAQWLEGRRFAANLNGTDFVPALIESAPRALRIGLFGGAPGVAERAAEALARLSPRHRICVIAHGFAAEPDIATALARLSAEPVDLLLVALGNPKQEMFIARRVGPQHARVAIGWRAVRFSRRRRAARARMAAPGAA